MSNLKYCPYSCVRVPGGTSNVVQLDLLNCKNLSELDDQWGYMLGSEYAREDINGLDCRIYDPNSANPTFSTWLRLEDPSCDSEGKFRLKTSDTTQQRTAGPVRNSSDRIYTFPDVGLQINSVTVDYRNRNSTQCGRAQSINPVPGQFGTYLRRDNGQSLFVSRDLTFYSDGKVRDASKSDLYRYDETSGTLTSSQNSSLVYTFIGDQIPDPSQLYQTYVYNDNSTVTIDSNSPYAYYPAHILNLNDNSLAFTYLIAENDTVVLTDIYQTTYNGIGTPLPVQDVVYGTYTGGIVIDASSGYLVYQGYIINSVNGSVAYTYSIDANGVTLLDTSGKSYTVAPAPSPATVAPTPSFAPAPSPATVAPTPSFAPEPSPATVAPTPSFAPEPSPATVAPTPSFAPAPAPSRPPTQPPAPATVAPTPSFAPAPAPSRPPTQPPAPATVVPSPTFAPALTTTAAPTGLPPGMIPSSVPGFMRVFSTPKKTSPLVFTKKRSKQTVTVNYVFNTTGNGYRVVQEIQGSQLNMFSYVYDPSSGAITMNYTDSGKQLKTLPDPKNILNQ